MSKELNEKELDKVAGAGLLDRFKEEMDEAAKEMMEAMKTPCPTCGTTLISKEIDGQKYLCCEKCNKNYPVNF